MVLTSTTSNGITTVSSEENFKWNELSSNTQGTINNVAGAFIFVTTVGGVVTVTLVYFGYKLISGLFTKN
jgi:hypothetical protein